MRQEPTLRINFDVLESQNDELKKSIPHGTKSEILRALLRLLLREIKRLGFSTVVYLLLEDKARLSFSRRDPEIVQILDNLVGKGE